MIINESKKLNEEVFDPDDFAFLLRHYSGIDKAYMDLYNRGKLPNGAVADRANSCIKVNGYKFFPKGNLKTNSAHPPKFNYDGSWGYIKES